MYKNKNMLTLRCPWTTCAHSEMNRFTKSTIVDCKISNGERRQFITTYIITQMLGLESISKQGRMCLQHVLKESLVKAHLDTNQTGIMQIITFCYTRI